MQEINKEDKELNQNQDDDKEPITHRKDKDNENKKFMTNKQILENMQKREEERKAKAEMKRKIQEKLDKESIVKPKPKKHLRPMSKRKKLLTQKLETNEDSVEDVNENNNEYDINNLNIDLNEITVDQNDNDTINDDINNLNDAITIESSLKLSPVRSPIRNWQKIDQPFPLRKILTKVEQQIVDARAMKVEPLPAE